MYPANEGMILLFIVL